MTSEDDVLSFIATPPQPQRLLSWQRWRSLLWSSHDESLTIKATSAAVWTTLSFAASFVLRLGSNLVLTRLLFPEAFGLMSLVSVFMAGLQMFTDVGIGPSIIHNRRGDDPVFLNTAWTIQVGRGTALWIASMLLTWPVSQFYGEPRLLWMLPIAGTTAFIQGFSTTAFFTANRQLNLGRRTLLELSSSMVGIVTMVGLALVWREVWVLLAGGIASSIARVFMGLVLLPNSHNRFCWDKSARHSLFNFGRWIFLNTLLAFVGLQADRLMMGKLLSIQLLGVYSIGITLIATGRDALLQISANVIFPAIARRADWPRSDIRDRVAHRRRLMLVLVGLALGFLIIFGDKLVLGLYDQRYVDASWMLPILALGAWPLVLYATNEGALYAIGKPAFISLGSAMRVTALFLLIPIGYHYWGLPGIVVAVAFLDVPRYMGSTYGLVREHMSFLRQDLLATSTFLGIISLMLFLRFVIGWGTPIDNLFAHAR